MKKKKQSKEALQRKKQIKQQLVKEARKREKLSNKQYRESEDERVEAKLEEEAMLKRFFNIKPSDHTLQRWKNSLGIRHIRDLRQL